VETQYGPPPDLTEGEKPAAVPVDTPAERALTRILLRGTANIEAARTALDAHVRARAIRLAYDYHLSDAQQKKLMLAGRGDVKHFLDQLDEAKRRLRPLKENDAQIMREAVKLREATNLIAARQGPIMTKVFKAMLSDEERARYETGQIERRQTRHKEVIEHTVDEMHLDMTLGLTGEQRAKLAALLIKEIQPPRAYGTSPGSVVFTLAAKLPEARLRPIFDDRQWNVLHERLSRYLRLEHNLVFMGFIPAEEP
jgi:hypothetical protein